LENRLQDLWSIMHFLNPGYLGSAEAFQRNFAGAIERWQDEAIATRLRALTGPFILRRLKTDKAIIRDLPEKNEMKEFCGLTKEQAALYRSVTQEALRQIAAASGIQRRGIILATLTKLKQVCNHPRHLLGDQSALKHRSGKLNRLTEMLEQALAEDDRSLIFTQYAEMGALLYEHLTETFGEALYLYGGTPTHKRAHLIEQFQNGGPRLFVLSLKAGGAGINLTRANRVFHYDRWWNPAVENQATDRAFRIGQTQAVQVHKMICRGTLEERIDELITRKLALADQIVGSGENWLTELSTDELRDLLLLRKEAVDD
jgi:SNF2 family DNA or RNA helicase